VNDIQFLTLVHMRISDPFNQPGPNQSMEAAMCKLTRVQSFLCVLGLLLVAPLLAHCQTTVRIGTYDSRAVALAYYNSIEQKQVSQNMQTEYQKAKAAGDEAKIKQLEAAGPARQELMHQQVFSTGTISNIMMTIQDKIPPIARESRVVLMSSKWDITYRESSIEYVDVTLQLVKLFNPESKVLQWIEEMKSQLPIPIDRLPRGVNY
jgi:hypothetical protein